MKTVLSTVLQRLRIYHPFLFALVPILTAYARNISYLKTIDVTRSIIVVIATTIILLLCLRLFTKEWDRAGFITSLILFVSLNYGYYLRFPPIFDLFGLQINRHLLIIAFWVIVLGIVTHSWVWKRVRPRFITQYLNYLAILSVFLPLRIILLYEYNALFNDRWMPELSPIEPSQAQMSEKPDIYYIILDSYARADVLDDIYQFDNKDFIHFLSERDFYIADQANSNYMISDLSLTSSLNTTYLDFLAQYKSRNDYDHTPMIYYLNQNRVFQFLKQMGYSIIAIESGYEPTNFTQADYYLDPQLTPFSPFEVMVLQTSIAWVPFELSAKNEDLILPGYDAHRQRILYQFDQLAKLNDLPSPKFVFVHIFAPHPPFVFGPHGEEITPSRLYYMGADDGSTYPGTKMEYIRSYINQMKYVNTLTESMINRLLQTASQPPMIILQADHGPRLLMDRDNFENSCIREHSSILNAYYFPDALKAKLYPSISPVNTFRIIFDEIFGTKLGLLEDRIFVSTSEIYQFDDITELKDETCE